MANYIERLEDDCEKYEEALCRIAAWADAYPLTAFPEPDLVHARRVLEHGGITLDAISASAIRHVVEQVGKIAKNALANTQE